MGKGVLISLAFLVAVLGYRFHTFLQPPPLVQLKDDEWWGPEATGNEKKIQPFKIDVSKKVLDDLKYRLDNHRPFTPPLQGVAQQYGLNSKLLEEVVDYWRKDYNWTERQKYLNQYPQYLHYVQGLHVHVVHVKPEPQNGYEIKPILLLHGWPGSVKEFYGMIPYLTTPQPGRNVIFEVIVPHIPGFGFSEPAIRPGLGAAQIAVVLKNLMKGMGFDKFYAHGGDFGAIILQHLTVLFPESVLGYHTNLCYISYSPKMFVRSLLSTVFPSWYVKKEHYDRVFPLKEKLLWRIKETGYLHIQATKPDTIGVGINDSPAGLAAYLLEKFITGTNFTWQFREDGGLKDAQYSYDDLLDNIMIYWITGSVTTTCRLYAETFNLAHAGLGLLRRPIEPPTACARFRYDFYTPDGFLDEIFPNIIQINDYEGGHFAAFQLPEVMSKDLYEAVEKFETLEKNRK